MREASPRRAAERQDPSLPRLERALRSAGSCLMGARSAMRLSYWREGPVMARLAGSMLHAAPATSS